MIPTSFLDELLANIATLSSVYHKPPESFVTRVKSVTQRPEEEDYADGNEAESSANPVDSATSPPQSSGSKQITPAAAPPATAPVPDLLGDLIGLDNSNSLLPVDQPVPAGPPLPAVLPASKGQGLQISARLTRIDGQVFYSMLFENNTQTVLDGFMIQFNKNTFGLAAGSPLQVPPLQPGTTARTLLPMVLFQNVASGPPNTLLQVAVKNNQQPVWYFNDKISLHAFFTEDGQMERTMFLELVNFEMPATAVGYIHRIGRTGRAWTISFSCTDFTINLLRFHPSG